MDIDGAIRLLRENGLSLRIAYYPSVEQSEFSTAFHEIAENLHSHAAGGISFSKEGAGDMPAVPALAFRHEAGGPIRYLALPKEREKDPFIEMLAAGLPGGIRMGEDAASAVRELEHPVDVTVFITSSCPNCPHAVRAANRLALLGRNVTVTVIDVEAFPRLGERYKIRSVPMIVIDGELLINHVIPVQELVSKILSRGSNAYKEEAFRSLVDTGNIDAAAKRLLDGGCEGFFLATWRKSSLSLRIALQMTAAEAMERDPNIFDGIVPGLIAELDSDDVALKGDTADLLGMIGHPAAKEPLQALLRDDNPDIVEIAQDALENLE